MCMDGEKGKKEFAPDVSICHGEMCDLSVPVVTSQWADFKSFVCVL